MKPARVVRIAVIGAGPAGLALAASLRERGVEVELIEKGPAPADSWARMPTGMRMNSPWGVNQLPGSRVGWHRSTQVGDRGEYREYLLDYARSNALNVLADTTVERVERSEDGRLRLRTSAGCVVADRVVNATGYFSAPFVPDVPGAEGADFPVITVPEYRDPEKLAKRLGEGRRVLIVGSRITAGQVAAELYAAGFRVTISHRSPLRFGWAPHIQRLGFRLYYPYERMRLRRSASFRARDSGHPMQGGRIRNLITSRSVATAPGIRSIDRERVIFADGSSQTFDALLWATGYRPALAHLESLVSLDAVTGLPPLREMESLEVPGLFFLGLDQETDYTSRMLRGIRRDAELLSERLTREGNTPSVAVAEIGTDPDFEVPFNRVHIAGRELEHITEAITRGRVSGDGPYTRSCARLLEERLGLSKAIMTSSCTAALEMAALLCDFQPGDEVILPSFTFVSTASAFVRAGATPVFVDIRPDTLNLDEQRLEEALTDRTRVVVPVHYAGVACEMDSIMAFAEAHGLRVIEDAAHAVGATYRGRALGSIGHLGCYSFHDTKNYVCGEGGALCVNDPTLVARAEVVRDKGTNRQAFLSGEVDKYTWVDVGSSYVPNEIGCAFLLGQLEQFDALLDRRRSVFEHYQRLLLPLEEDGFLRRPRIPLHCESNAHNYYILLKDRPTRDGLLAHFRSAGISAVFHYVPLHSSPAGRRLCRAQGSLQTTDLVADRLVRLPFFYELRPAQIERVTSEVDAFLRRFGARIEDRIAQALNMVAREPGSDDGFAC